MEDIDPVANMKALPEDSEKAQDAEVKKIIKEKENNAEDVASDCKALKIDEPEEI